MRFSAGDWYEVLRRAGKANPAARTSSSALDRTSPEDSPHGLSSPAPSPARRALARAPSAIRPASSSISSAFRPRSWASCSSRSTSALLSLSVFLFALALFLGGYLLQFAGHALEGTDPGEIIYFKRKLGLPYVEFPPAAARPACRRRQSTRARAVLSPPPADSRVRIFRNVGAGWPDPIRSLVPLPRMRRPTAAGKPSDPPDRRI